jgi:hypothetical protein
LRWESRVWNSKPLDRAAGFRLRAIGTTTRLSSGPDICTFRDHVSDDPYEKRALSENRIIGTALHGLF